MLKSDKLFILVCYRIPSFVFIIIIIIIVIVIMLVSLFYYHYYRFQVNIPTLCLASAVIASHGPRNI